MPARLLSLLLIASTVEAGAPASPPSPLALDCNRRLRRHLVSMPPVPAMRSLLDALAKVKSNDQMYATMSASSAAPTTPAPATT